MVKLDMARIRFGLWFLALAAGGLSTFLMVGESRFLERSAKFSEGLETCFGRLRQSYLLGKGEREFFKGTESCFSEMVAYMEQHFPASVVQGMAPINQLVIDTHWFHKTLMGPQGNSSRPSEKFGQLESARRGLVERLQDERRRRMEQLEADRMGLWGAWGAILLLLALSALNARKEPEHQPQEVAQTPPAPRERVQLGESLGRVLSSLANEIFSRGIRVEPDIGEDAPIDSPPDLLEKALERILAEVLDSLEEGARLKISYQRRGEGAIVSLGPLGRGGFSHQMGSTLLRECGGRMEETPTGWIQISFGGEKTGHRRVFKGKKKDILRQLHSRGELRG